jgi:SAM-dependent MidA family methyltransferase
MRQVLTSPEGGYYTTRPEGGGEVFGKKGDFVTSPEISQVFGELVGIWTITEWMAQGRRRSGVQLIEVGPGKGTLMDDMLRVSYFILGSRVGMSRADRDPRLDIQKLQTLCVESRSYLSG